MSGQATLELGIGHATLLRLPKEYGRGIWHNERDAGSWVAIIHWALA